MSNYIYPNTSHARPFAVLMCLYRLYLSFNKAFNFANNLANNFINKGPKLLRIPLPHYKTQ